MQPYYRDGTEMILEYMKDAFGTFFHAYFEGDPGDIPESKLPALVVWKKSGTSNPGPTGTQDVAEEIVIQAVLNKKDDFGAAASAQDMDLTNRKLRMLAEGRDEQTAEYLPNTLCGVLSANITLGDNVLQMTIGTDYILARRANNMLTSEVHVTVGLRERVIIRQRQ